MPQAPLLGGTRAAGALRYPGVWVSGNLRGWTPVASRQPGVSSWGQWGRHRCATVATSGPGPCKRHQ